LRCVNDANIAKLAHYSFRTIPCSFGFKNQGSGVVGGSFIREVSQLKNELPAFKKTSP